ncbi:MAG: hypothetical protein MK317_12720, partial [Pseudomonadales bacterium]|nr:hypothetical protein [Pseudomonadales bacterium]
MSHPPIRFLDRAKETTTTTGSGSITLGGAVAGFVAISGIGNGNSTYYTITENNDFEVGIGTYDSDGNTLSRAEVFSSSNSDNSKIDLGGGATVFITYSADKSVTRTSGNYVGIGIDPEYPLHVVGTGRFDTVKVGDDSLLLDSTTITFSDGTTQSVSPTGDISIVSGLTVTNSTNIATNATNITATGTVNAAAITVNAASISTNAGNISTNASNIAMTGATNASAITANTSSISSNTSNISTNASNITATGAINAADIIEVSGDVATNTSNISTNTSNISTNTSNISTNATNITATGEIKAAQ